MENYTNNMVRYNSIIKACVLLGELCICSGLFYIFYLWTIYRGKYTELTATLPQVLIIIILCYLICSIQGGVVLHLRKIYPYQIIMRVFRNVFYFSILTGTVLSVGKFMNICSLFFPAYISTLFLLLSLFRLTFRDILKRFRSQGKNIRYVVLVGSTSNNIEMYHELSDDPSTGYKVNGYFDDKPNPEMPSQCCYLGRPEEVQNYLKKNSYIHYLFCCLPSHRSEIIVPIINYCENHLVHFYSVPNLHNYLHNRVYFNMMGNVPYLSLRQDPLSRTENKLLKRTFDIVFSLLFLCTLFPIILIIVTIITKQYFGKFLPKD